MNSEQKTLYLIDGMALAYRGHFALFRNPRMSSTGLNTSAIFVFANTLLDIITSKKPTHIAVAFDTPEPTFRHVMYPEYKAQREAMPEELSQALPYIFRLCEGFNIPVLRNPGWEADDVIGTLARQAEADGFVTYMVTPDKDYGQLVSENTYMCKPARSGKGAEILGIPEILEKWGIKRIDQLIDIFGLMGDASDNIPGVPGIGEKTAQKLIAEYDTIENLLSHTDELKGKRQENLVAYAHQARLSRELVTINCEVPMELGLADFVSREVDQAALQQLFQELEFSNLGKKIFGQDFEASPTAAVADVGEGAVTLKTIEDVAHTYSVADTVEKRSEWVERLQQSKQFCFDTETTGLDPRSCELIGLSFAIEPHVAVYVPLPDDRIGVLTILEEFRSVFRDETIAKIGHNLKFDVGFLAAYDIEVGGALYDTMLAASLVVPEMRRTMDYLSAALLGYQPVPITELIGKKGQQQLLLSDVADERVAEYAAEDADVTLQLWLHLEPRIEEEGQTRVFVEVESPLIQPLVAMEAEGIRVDLAVLSKLSKSLASELVATERTIFGLAGGDFNLNSPKQLGEVLFDRMGLDDNAKKTQKTGQYQTDEKVLSKLALKHDIAKQVLHYRECAKLKSTYVDALPEAVSRATGRVHTSFEQAVTSTGRMQSHDPNLQNIPVRSELGREIRKAFVSREPGWKLLAADYSQVELRVMAELSGDVAMREAFEAGLDIHNATAARIYGVDVEDVTSDMRRQSKTVNFGIIYGISAFGLSERLGMARSDAAFLIDQYFAEYPGVKAYMESTIEFCREHGYVQTITGRRRWLKDVNSRNGTVRKGAERNAINAPIQGTAADMIKIAMSKVYNRLNSEGFASRLLLQVHDELLFDLHPDEETRLRAMVAEEMEGAIALSVPVVVDIGVGDNWLQAH